MFRFWVESQGTRAEGTGVSGADSGVTDAKLIVISLGLIAILSHFLGAKQSNGPIESDLFITSVKSLCLHCASLKE